MYGKYVKKININGHILGDYLDVENNIGNIPTDECHYMYMYGLNLAWYNKDIFITSYIWSDTILSLSIVF